MKTYEVYKNGTQQGELKAPSLKEARKLVFATYGEHREVYKVEQEPIEKAIIDKANKLAKDYFPFEYDDDKPFDNLTDALTIFLTPHFEDDFDSSEIYDFLKTKLI